MAHEGASSRAPRAQPDRYAERVFAHVRRIRRKIEADPAHPTFLLTVRGEGFRLSDVEVPWPSRGKASKLRTHRAASSRITRPIARGSRSASAG
ncbi:MAG: winged helix-turn-helix domain-containing protein [Actinomycetota bacterium]